MRQYTADFEPAATQPFDDLWERKLTSVQQVKGEKNYKLHSSSSSAVLSWTVVDGFFFAMLYSSLAAICNTVVYSIILFYLVFSLSLIRTEEMHKFIAEQLQTGRVPLCINPQSAAFKSFARWVDALHNLCFPILFSRFFSLLLIIFCFHLFLLLINIIISLCFVLRVEMTFEIKIIN